MSDEGWETWQDLKGERTKSQVTVYLGREVRREADRRARAVGLSVGSYIKECVLRFMRLHGTDADPRSST